MLFLLKPLKPQLARRNGVGLKDCGFGFSGLGRVVLGVSGYTANAQCNRVPSTLRRDSTAPRTLATAVLPGSSSADSSVLALRCHRSTTTPKPSQQRGVVPKTPPLKLLFMCAAVLGNRQT